MDTHRIDGEMVIADKKPFDNSISGGQIQFLKGNVYTDLPSKDKHIWKGLVEYNGNVKAVNYTNLALRGSILSNTEYMFGVVVYVGNQHELSKMKVYKSNKENWVLAKMHRSIYWVFAAMVLLITTQAIAQVYYENTYSNELVDPALVGSKSTKQSIKAFWLLLPQKLILNSHTVPMSLYIAIVVLKYFQF